MGHDSIAEAVCAANHKKDVNRYIWIRSFEELEQTLDDVMDKNGPFDIVEGGPPCQECKFIIPMVRNLTNPQFFLISSTD